MYILITKLHTGPEQKITISQNIYE